MNWLSAWIQALINKRCAFFHEAWVLFYDVNVKAKYLPVEEARHKEAIAAFDPFVVRFVKL